MSINILLGLDDVLDDIADKMAGYDAKALNQSRTRMYFCTASLINKVNGNSNSAIDLGCLSPYNSFLLFFFISLNLFSSEDKLSNFRSKTFLGVGRIKYNNLITNELNEFSNYTPKELNYYSLDIIYLLNKKLGMEFNYYIPENKSLSYSIANYDNSSILSFYNASERRSDFSKISLNYFLFDGFKKNNSNLGLQLGVGQSSSLETKFQKYIPQIYQKELFNESLSFFSPNSVNIYSEKRLFFSLGLFGMFNIFENTYIKYNPDLKFYDKEKKNYLINSYTESINLTQVDLRNTYLSKLYIESRNYNSSNISLDYTISILYNF